MTSTRLWNTAVEDALKPAGILNSSINRVTGHHAGQIARLCFIPSTPLLMMTDAGPARISRYGANLDCCRTVSDMAPQNRIYRIEYFLSLVDIKGNLFASDLRQITVEALCTNRDLSLLTPVDEMRTRSAPRFGTDRCCALHRGPDSPIAGARAGAKVRGG